jgi:hypothetical protein
MAKQWTDEERRKASERAKARWAQRHADSQNKNSQAAYAESEDGNDILPDSQTQNDEDIVTRSDEIQDEIEHNPWNPPVKPDEPPVPEPSSTILQGDYGDILKLVLEMQKTQTEWMMRQSGNTNGPAVDNGQLRGTVEKYSLDSAQYQDPRNRLKEESKLQRFAFKMNYDLNYEMQVAKYETVDHVRYKEPRFKLELVRVVLDEETGEPTNGRYVLCNMIMHEDVDAALAIAEQQGLVLDHTDERAFLDELRYLRYRDWLLDCFYPPKPNEESQRNDVVIGNRLVQYYEVSSESGKGLKKTDWDSLAKVKF